MTVQHERLAKAIAIIDEAVVLALTFFHARIGIETKTKGVQDFVSEADTSVERLVRERLDAAFPGETVLGEEMGGRADGAYWIIDPIDGTANFLRGSPLWGISLGFVRSGRPELGVVAIPVLKEVYAAADGTGLLLNGRAISRDTSFEDVQVMSLGDSASKEAEEVAALNVGLRHAGWVVESIRSTSIGLAFAARGIFDGHFQKLTTMWDIAGGAVLAREAGLDVRIGVRAQSGIPWIAAGTPKLMTAAGEFWHETQ
ncbi:MULTISPECIES: inositol monophosphatase family protein [Agrobacterium]|uniref:Inositol monophosphatase family protein n=1 Tax=Agrobacterium rosae TaxID=1972867 RepID=A0A1R3TLZ1_9HYPH|nr:MULTISPECIES: inositol monophosphatase family protein [Agrobacterium]MDX8303862.1 inositol monophosphatase family protein [Agrobacterium rosae]MDX8313979.1 inositol monophosphatase family protein [Agrobacterium rosae]POO55314.1 myo-inositol-1-monophosphatase [Agrobacterium rosae]SCX10870.1 Inositol-1-monophosphatase [Agrobacterium sp. DSM 25558]SCX23019.1 Inositol-1-monophosphatase [Agrobacterium rosae]